MKTKLILAAVCALLLAPSLTSQTLAGPCVQQSLAKYIALGSIGCTFDGILYRDFTYATASTNGVTASQILVTPAPLPTSAAIFQGLNFSANWSVAAGQSSQSTIGYNAQPMVVSGPASTSVLTLDLGTSKVNGIIGSVDIKEAVITGPSITDLEVYDRCADACTLRQQDSVTLTPLPSFTATLTISLTGGSAGASLKNFAVSAAFGIQPE